MRVLSYALLSLSLICITGCADDKKLADCPNWSSNPMHNYDNTDFSNQGCAYYNNLAAEVVNPEDLQKGHGQAISSGDRESVNIQKYLTAVPQTVNTQGTTSSSR